MCAKFRVDTCKAMEGAYEKSRGGEVGSYPQGGRGLKT